MTDHVPFATLLPTDGGPAGARRHAILRELLATTTWVTTRRLAARAGVTQRTIHRDIAKLRSAGVPIEGEAGRGMRLEALGADAERPAWREGAVDVG